MAEHKSNALWNWMGQTYRLVPDNVIQFPKHYTQEQVIRGRKLGHLFLSPVMEAARKQAK